MKPARETELHAPVAAFLRGLGYEIRSEVKDCDIVALRPRTDGEEDIVVVELKRGLTIDLLVQGVKRQRAAEEVYLAIPRPAQFWFNRKWRDLQHLVRRLELGLILVGATANNPFGVEVILEPQAFDRTKSRSQHRAKRVGLLAEFKARSADMNIGGSTGTSLMTAYRERSLRVAHQLKSAGPQAPAALRVSKTDTKTAAMLARNVYGWFVKVERGIYDLSPEGQRALDSFVAEHPAYEWQAKVQS